MPQAPIQNEDRKRQGGYLLINPEAFSPDRISRSPTSAGAESALKPDTSSIIYSQDLYDIKEDSVPSSELREQTYNGINLKTLDPVLARSLNPDSESVRAQAASQIETMDFSPPKVRQSDEIEGRVARMMDSADYLTRQDGVRSVVLELQKSRGLLLEEIKLREDRLGGVKRNLRTFEKEYEEAGSVTLGVSSAVKFGYTGLHKLGGLMKKNFNWNVFSSPPTSLSDMHLERQAEAKKEIVYREALLAESKKALTELDLHLNKVDKIQERLTSEPDPGEFLALSRELRSSVREVTAVLNKGLDTDNAELKADWENLRKSVTKSFENLDQQLGYAEVTLKATEKAVIIGGAIGVTAATGGVAGAGLLTGVLAGGAVGAFGSTAQMAGHYAGDQIFSGGQNFNLSNELSELRDDVKDASLYALGNGLSNALLGWSGKAVLSNGQVVSPNLIKALLQNPFKKGYLTNASGAAMSTVAGTSRGVAGGLTRGILTEAPAAFTDTGHAYLTRGALLDPSGELRALQIPELKLLLRAVTIRLATAGVGGSLGSAFQGARNNVTTLINPQAFKPTSSFANPIRRSLARAVNAPITAVDLTADLYGGVYTEAVVRGWFYGADGKISDDDLEQIMVSSLAGHMAGRMQHGSLTALHQNRFVSAQRQAAAYQNHADAQHNRLGLVNDQTIVTSVGSKGDIKAVPDGIVNRAFGVNLGDNHRLAAYEASRQAHRVSGQMASQVDRKLGRTIAGDATRIGDRLRTDIPAQGNATGKNRSLEADRIKTIDAYEKEITQRASAIRLLGRDDPNRQAYAERLAEHVKNFNNELTGDPALGSRFRRFVDGIKDPYGLNHPTLRMQKSDQTVIGRVEDFFASNFPTLYRSRMVQSFLKLPDNVKDIAVGLGIAGFTIPTSSLWGSWGLIGGAGYAGSVLLVRPLVPVFQSGVALLSFANNTSQRLTGIPLYRRGSVDGVAKLAARAAEGEVLLNELRNQRRMDDAVRLPLINRLQTEINQTNQLLERANMRGAGLISPIPRVAGTLGSLVTFRRLAPDQPNELQNAFRSRPVENRNRILSDQSVGELRDRAEVFFNRSVRRGARGIAQDAANQAVRTFESPDIDLGRIRAITNLFLSPNSNVEIAIREGANGTPGVRQRMLDQLDNTLSLLPLNDARRSNLLAARQLILDVEDPILQFSNLPANSRRPEIRARLDSALDRASLIIRDTSDVEYMRHVVSQLTDKSNPVLVPLKDQISLNLEAELQARIGRGDLSADQNQVLREMVAALRTGQDIQARRPFASLDRLAMDFRTP